VTIEYEVKRIWWLGLIPVILLIVVTVIAIGAQFLP
jgi:hypothetical protein